MNLLDKYQEQGYVIVNDVIDQSIVLEILKFLIIIY